MPQSGQQLEDEVFEYVSCCLIPELLGLNPERSAVYRRKTYYSSTRQDVIEFDVSCELAIQGSETPSIIWLFECKDYGRKVGVADIEEFHSKLTQVGAHKGTVVTRSGFQRGAISFARDRGVGLLRLSSPDQAHYILHTVVAVQVPATETCAVEALTLSSTEVSHFSAAGFTCASTPFVRENLPAPNRDHIEPNRGLLEYFAWELFQFSLSPKQEVCASCTRHPSDTRLIVEQGLEYKDGKEGSLVCTHEVCERCYKGLIRAVHLMRGLAIVSGMGVFVSPPLLFLSSLPVGPRWPFMASASAAITCLLAYVLLGILLARGDLRHSWWNVWAQTALLRGRPSARIERVTVNSWWATSSSVHPPAFGILSHPREGGEAFVKLGHKRMSRISWLVLVLGALLPGFLVGEISLFALVWFIFGSELPLLARTAVSVVAVLFGSAHASHAMLNLLRERIGHMHGRGYLLRDLIGRASSRPLIPLLVLPPSILKDE